MKIDYTSKISCSTIILEKITASIMMFSTDKSFYQALYIVVFMDHNVQCFIHLISLVKIGVHNKLACECFDHNKEIDCPAGMVGEVFY